MTKTKRLRGECQHCGGSLQFPAESIGLMAQCPRCAEETELMLAMPPQEPLIPRKVMVWTVITVTLLVAGFVYFLAQLNYYEQRAVERRKKSASPAPAVTNAPASATPGLRLLDPPRPQPPAVLTGSSAPRKCASIFPEAEITLWLAQVVISVYNPSQPKGEIRQNT